MLQCVGVAESTTVAEQNILSLSNLLGTKLGDTYSVQYEVMKTVHTFAASNAKGKIGESVISQYFKSLGYEVTKLKVKEQIQLMYDLDCIRSDKQFKIEVKTELRAEETGNIFYETVVNDKPGWCLKYLDDSNVIIIWYLPISNRILCLPANKLRSLDYEAFPYKTVRNPTYSAGGYVIPLTYMEERCKVIELGDVHEQTTESIH